MKAIHLIIVICSLIILTGCSVKHIDTDVGVDVEIITPPPAVEVVYFDGTDYTKESYIDEPAADHFYITHIVGTWEGDRACLWNIALEYYGNPYEYVMIYQANSQNIDNPDLIYPGQELLIPMVIE